MSGGARTSGAVGRLAHGFSAFVINVVILNIVKDLLLNASERRLQNYRAGLQPFNILPARKPGALLQADMERAFSA